MEYRRLGRTDLQVSVAGLGTGGYSHFGQRAGRSKDDARRLVRRALDQGVNFFDTARGYMDSEKWLAHALDGVPRDQYILSTKLHNFPHGGQMASADDMRTSIDESLQRLGVDTIDLMMFHSLKAEQYDRTVDIHLPAVLEAQAAGKVRFIGASEPGAFDGPHLALRRALDDDVWDVFLVAYNILHASADRYVFPAATAKDVGIVIMVAVRLALSVPERLREVIADLKDRELIAADAVPDDDPLDWLVHDDVESVPAAAYRFAQEPDAVACVLSGTANPEHLDANLAAILAGNLPAADRQRLRDVFGALDEPIGD